MLDRIILLFDITYLIIFGDDSTHNNNISAIMTYPRRNLTKFIIIMSVLNSRTLWGFVRKITKFLTKLRLLPLPVSM